MRLPRHDTPLRLPAEQPRAALAADEALLDQVMLDRSRLERWWLPSAPVVVVGVGMRSRLAEIVDLERCARAGVDVLQRQAGGGALLLDEHMLCGAICVPTSSIPSDVTESYRWLGDFFADRLRGLGIATHRVEVEEARADVASLRSQNGEVAKVLLTTCYGALSPHEVTANGAVLKLVGLAQIRRRHAALFQIGLLIEDQSQLADYVLTTEREALKNSLKVRTVGLNQLTDRSVAEVAAAIAGATPSVP
jgi:lipoate-protein ligase A